MATKTVIELNQNNANGHVRVNGEYKVTLAHPVTVNEGDQIDLRMASIDSQKLDSNTIVIENDVNLSVAFSIYDVDYDALDKRNQDGTAPWPEPTFDYYAAYNAKEIQQLVTLDLDIIGYNAPKFNAGGQPGRRFSSAGSFVVDSDLSSPAGWAFKALIQYMDADNNLQTAELHGNNAVQGTLPGGDEGGSLWHATGSAITCNPDKVVVEFQEGSIKLLSCVGYWPSRPQYGGSTSPGGSIYPGFTGDPFAGNSVAVPVKTSQFRINQTSIKSTTISAGGTHLDIQIATATLREGTYDPKSLAVQITQLFNDSQGLKDAVAGSNGKYIGNNPILQRTDDAANENMIFRRVDFPPPTGTIVFNNGNTYQYKDDANTKIPYYVGATQFAIEYGSAGEVFSINYAHMPLENPTEVGTQNVGLFTTGTVGGNDLRYHQVKSASGIAIHQLTPPLFWQDQLGIYDQLIVPLKTDSNGIQYYTETDLEAKITYGYASLSSFILAANAGKTIPYTYPRKMKTIPPTDNPTFIDVTGDTRAIIGNTPVTNSTGGYYLVEVLGLAPRSAGYLDTTENNPTINAIVSKQYDSNDSVTGFGDSGINYMHKGAPYMIRELAVRILDPKTKLPVSDLGPNNSLFFDITKPILQPQQSKK